jgi:hypothetical protein
MITPEICPLCGQAVRTLKEPDIYYPTFVRFYQKGMPAPQIAKMYNLSVNDIYKGLREMGCEMRHGSGAIHSIYQEDKDISYISEAIGETAKEILEMVKLKRECLKQGMTKEEWDEFING